MTEFKIACHCGFATDDPQEFLNHILTTGHVFGEMDIKAESGELAGLVEVFATIRQMAPALDAGDPVELPEGMEINPISRDDILADDELSDEQKQEILARWDELEQRRKMD